MISNIHLNAVNLFKTETWPFADIDPLAFCGKWLAIT